MKDDFGAVREARTVEIGAALLSGAVVFAVVLGGLWLVGAVAMPARWFWDPVIGLAPGAALTAGLSVPIVWLLRARRRGL